MFPKTKHRSSNLVRMDVNTRWGIATVHKIHGDGDLELKWPNSNDPHDVWTLHEEHVTVLSTHTEAEPHRTKTEPEWQSTLHEQVYKFLRYQRTPASFDARQRKDFVANARKRFYIEGPDLYRRRDRQPKTTSLRAQAQYLAHPSRQVPTLGRARALVFEDHAAFHDGRARTETRLGARYLIIGIRELCQEAREKCNECNAWVPAPKEVSEFIFTERPMQLLIFDLTKMQMVCSRTGHQYILVARCHFTKYVWTRSTATKTKEEILSALDDMLKSEAPFERWHCDNGGEFCNDLMEVLLEAFGSPKLSHSIPRNPRCQGLVEIANRCIKRKIVQKAMEDGYEQAGAPYPWTQILPGVTANENTSPHGLYKIPPFFILRLKWPGAPNSEYIQGAARERMYTALIEKQREYAAKRTKGKIKAFDVGDVVAVKAGEDARKKKKAIAPWGAKGVVHEVDEFHVLYRVRWLTRGLGGEKEGQISSRRYHRIRLRGAHHQGQTNTSGAQDDNEVRYVHVPAATVQNILPAEYERTPDALSNLFLLGVVNGTPNGKGQWTVDVPAIDKKLVVSSAWLRRYGETWKAHGMPELHRSYHSDEDSDDELLSTKRHRQRERMSTNIQSKKWKPEHQMQSDDTNTPTRKRKVTTPKTKVQKKQPKPKLHMDTVLSSESEESDEASWISPILQRGANTMAKILGMNKLQKQKPKASVRANVTLEEPCEVDVDSRAIHAAAEYVLRERQAWTWKFNSCHLDTMLLIELAGYAMAPQRTGIPVTKCIHQLQSVLALVTTTARDRYRDMWHRYLSTYTNNDLPHGDQCDIIYHWIHIHKHLRLAGHKNTMAEIRNVENDRCIQIYIHRKGCTTGCNQDKSHVSVFGCLTLTYNWERVTRGAST